MRDINLIKRTFLIVNLLVAGTFQPEAIIRAGDPAKPNIIFFITDDTDKYQLGCYGGNVYTPNIDRLAAEGVMFHQAYVTSTVCTPSRYSLATGRYPGRSYYSNYLKEYPSGSQGHPEFNVGLEQDFMNIGKVLKDNGYVTGWIGKFHLGSDTSLKGLTSAEEKYLSSASSDDPKATELFRKEERAYRDYIVNKGFSWAKNIYEGNIKDPFAEHNLEWTIAAALEFIETNKDRPFYLHFNTTLLHGPDKSWERSLQYPEVTGEGIVDHELEAEMPDRSTIIERIQSNGYNLKENPAGITWLDDGVGAILNKLNELGLEENTMVVFVPDHGSANKASLFNCHGTNIPLIIKYPKEISPGTHCNALVQVLDMIPTFFDMGSIMLPEGYILDGKSIRPLFQNPEEKIHESLYFEIGCARAVMTENYKYIAVRYTEDRINEIKDIPENKLKEQIIRKIIYLDRNLGISLRGLRYSPEYLSPDQLYDLTADPEEKTNLVNAPDYNDILTDMKKLLTGYLETFENRPFGEFIPGPNASPPDVTVTRYIRNIQDALRQGAEIIDGKIICDGNCVKNPVSGYNPHKEAVPDEYKIVYNGTDISIKSFTNIDKIKLYDLCGRLLYTENTSVSGELTIDKTTYSPGVYLISIAGKDLYQTQKILF
jgi:arylsulfatase A-like enzyme